MVNISKSNYSMQEENVKCRKMKAGIIKKHTMKYLPAFQMGSK